MKKSELRQIVREEIKRISLVENKFKEAFYKMDKWMPDDPDLQNEFYEIIGKKNPKKLAEFLEENGDEEGMKRYGLTSATMVNFAKYIIKTEG